MPQDSWCTICSEECNTHPTICTICGNRLQTRPNQHSTTNPSSNAVDEILTVVNRLQQQHPNRLQLPPMEDWTRMLEGEWQSLPPEILNPNPMNSSSSRPTSAECIKLIPRIKIEEHSAILHEVSISLLLPPDNLPTVPVNERDNTMTMDTPVASTLKRKQILFDAVMAEFPPYPPYDIIGRLMYAGTGKMSTYPNVPQNASMDTQKSSSSTTTTTTTTTNTIAYMERGDGVTFVQKAIVAQKLGCSAVICGNNVPIWPYIMKDLTLEARKLDLKIPMVMVKRSDGNRIRELLLKHDQKHRRDIGSIRVTINAKHLSSDSDDCVVCREPFVIGDIVMRLPFCFHAFHDDCALSWLTKHNTCPFCRRELPTDDPVYEAERRQQQRTHAGSSTPEQGVDSPWDSLFG